MDEQHGYERQKKDLEKDLDPLNQFGPRPHEGYPAVKLKAVPIVKGPLSRLSTIRPTILEDVIKKTKEELSGTALDLLLGEALYSEKLRLRRNRPSLFTRERHKA